MKTTIWVGLLLALSGCERSADRAPQEGSGEPRLESAKPAADNTDRNERDRESNALTPGDQGEGEADRKMTQDIRQSIMQQDALSMNARNVKVITRDGVVTLRGPVDSAEEKARIADLARNTSGVKRVDNQLEVAAE